MDFNFKNQTETTFVTYQVSKQNYTEKPEKNASNYGSSNFAWTTTTIDELAFNIEKGKIIAPSERKLQSALTSPVQLVCYDIEHTPIKMEDYVESLSIKPTLYYNSFSHGTNPEDNRFRLVYVFDSTFEGSDYQTIYNAISTENRMGKELDKLVVNQCYNGTNKKVYGTGIVYEVPNLNTKTPTYIQQDSNIGETVLSDFKNLPYSEFIDKYDKEFAMAIPTHTDYKNSGDERYSVCPEEYYEIPRNRRWNKETKQYVTLRWKDGENRHKKIYVAGIVWRHLIPNVTSDEMLYLITREICNYYEMNDNKFTKSYILKLVDAIMVADLETVLNEIPHATFKVNDIYCMENRVDKRTVVCQINNENRSKLKEYKYKIIDWFYNKDLSEAENLQILSDNGIEISLRFLQRYKKDRGFTKSKKKTATPISNHIPKPITIRNGGNNTQENITAEQIMECYDFGLSEWDNWKELNKTHEIQYNEYLNIVEPFISSTDVFSSSREIIKPNEKWSA